MSDRRSHAERVERYQRRRLEHLQMVTTRAIEKLPDTPAPVKRLLQAITLRADERGACWVGAVKMAEALDRSERRMRDVFKLARTLGWLRMVAGWSRGGKHRTNVYVIAFGAWRPDVNSPTMDHDFGERVKAVAAAFEAWLEDLFTEHRGTDCDCWRFAPAWLHGPPIEWQTVK